MSEEPNVKKMRIVVGETTIACDPVNTIEFTDDMIERTAKRSSEWDEMMAEKGARVSLSDLTPWPSEITGHVSSLYSDGEIVSFTVDGYTLEGIGRSPEWLCNGARVKVGVHDCTVLLLDQIE